MRRKTLLTVGLCLLLTAGLLPGRAAAAAPVVPMAELIWLGDDSQTTAATAVHAAFGEETVWLAPAALLPDDVALYLMTDQGTYTRVLGAEELGGSGLAVLTLADPELLTEAISLSGSGYVGPVTGYLADRSRVESPTERVAPVTLRGHGGMTLTSLPGLLSGAVVTDSEGLLAGLVMSTWGEGEGRYGALTARGITEALLAADRTALPIQGTEDSSARQAVPVHASVTLDQGLICVDWRDQAYPGETESGVYAAVLEDVDNRYYTSWRVDHGDEKLVYFPAVPERTYHVWVGYWPERPESFIGITVLPPEAEITPPDLGNVTDHGFRQECWLALRPASEQLTGMEKLERTENITRAQLESGEYKLCLQVVNHYSVTEESQDNLVFALFGPDGTCAAEASGFIWAPEFMPDDVWNKDCSGMLEDMLWDVETYPEGTYTVAYYIGGRLAGGATFTLGPAEAAPETDGTELPEEMLQRLKEFVNPAKP